MRHRKKGRKLNRTAGHRKALLRNMVTTFFELEQIETTDAKAKEVRTLAERLVTLAKRQDGALAARRRVHRVVRDKKVVAKLFNEIGPRFTDRPGGYTRIVKVTNRRGDAAPLSVLQFVTEPVTFKERKPRREEEVAEPRAREPEVPEEIVEETGQEVVEEVPGRAGSDAVEAPEEKAVPEAAEAALEEAQDKTDTGAVAQPDQGEREPAPAPESAADEADEGTTAGREGQKDTGKA